MSCHVFSKYFPIGKIVTYLARAVIPIMITSWQEFLSICFFMVSNGIISPVLSQPGHDFCEQAIDIAPGETLYNQTNRGAATALGEIPEGTPVTCIQTFENDVWYRLIADTAYSWYQIDIQPYECSTPAGLQAMVVETESCDAGTFIYKDCANPRETGNVTMFVDTSDLQASLLIYVDGYDGTECGFTISVKGFTEDPRSIEDIRQSEMDYQSPPPYYEPVSASLKFENNVALISWEDESLSSTVLFQVQRSYLYGSRIVGTVVGTVVPRQTVGSELTTYYEYIDLRAFREETEYCYRIVRIDDRGAKAYSEPLCAESILIQTFWASDVFPSSIPGTYEVQYNTKKKQDLRFSLKNEAGEELKALVKKREPKGDGIVQIDMTAYPVGEYVLEVSAEEGNYRRRFFRQPE